MMVRSICKNSRLSLHLSMALFMGWIFISIPFHHHEHGETDHACSICLMLADGNACVSFDDPLLILDNHSEIPLPVPVESIVKSIHPRNTLAHGPPAI